MWYPGSLDSSAQSFYLVESSRIVHPDRERHSARRPIASPPCCMPEVVRGPSRTCRSGSASLNALGSVDPAS
jgi:hypothetical protein